MLFALVGMAAIVLLSSIGLDSAKRAHRHTGGEQEAAIERPGEAVDEARRTGNAAKGLKRLRARRQEFPDYAPLAAYEALLAAELTTGLAEIDPAHPAYAKIQVELRNALRVRASAELSTRARAKGGIDASTLVGLLALREADDQIATHTARLFQKLAVWYADTELVPGRPDERAARADKRLNAEGEPATEELLLSVIHGFRAANRPRARLRWALHAFGLLPGSDAIMRELVAAYLERGDVLEAFAVVGAALQERPEDRDLWDLRATYAGWLGEPHAEVTARERMLTFGEDRELRERLLELYQAIGDPAKAIPHAEALTRDSADRKEQLLPIRLALKAGDIDRALAMLTARANADDDPAWWRERIIEFARQDMREDRMVSELRWLHAHDPEGGYEARLESVFRRRARIRDLADLLEQRLRRDSSHAETEAELLRLLESLGEHDRARALLRARMERNSEPLEFFRSIASYRELQIKGIAAHAQRMAESPRMTAEHVPEILALVAPLASTEENGGGYRTVAQTVARRFPRIPEAREYLMHAADSAENDAGRAEAMQKLAAAHPEDIGFIEAWAERARWSGDLEGETRARLNLLELAPENAENRSELAGLFDAQNKPQEALAHRRVLAEGKPLDSPEQLRLVDSLMANDHIEEAMALLERRASLPNASVEDQLHVADDLFAKAQYDRAIRFYDAALEDEPENAHALLRQGQIRAWTNSPRAAIPFLERRLAVTDEDGARVRFTLGECYWATQQPRRGTELHTAALDELQAQPERTIEQDVMVAKMLTRFGRHDEARPIFERVLAAMPDNADIVLDYADSMVSSHDLARARTLVDKARAMRPQYARSARLDGVLSMQERDYERAAEVLSDTIRRYGPDAGTAGELARAHLLSGDYRSALDSYRRASLLAGRNTNLEEQIDILSDRLARMLHLHVSARAAGEDRAVTGWLAGSTLLEQGRTRLGVALGASHYSGRAAAVDGGLSDVDTTVFHARIAATHRFHRRNRVGGGVEFFPGANGNAPVAAWAGAYLTGIDPAWSVRVRGWYNELFTDPTAAAGLGGRSTGAFAEGDYNLGDRFWLGGSVRYERLSLDFGGATPSDPRLIVGGTLGWRALQGPPRVGEPHRITQPFMPGVVGPFRGPDEGRAQNTMLSVWLNASTYQVLGDAELTTLIPLGKRLDYLTVAARFDRPFADGWGFMVEGYAGRELQQEQTVYGVAAGIGWRPRETFELDLVGAYGSALGRSNDEDSFRVRLGLTWRW